MKLIENGNIIATGKYNTIDIIDCESLIRKEKINNVFTNKNFDYTFIDNGYCYYFENV